MQEKIIYFEKAGKENTLEVLSLVRERARARGISKVVLASTRGDTAKAALDAFAGSDIRLIYSDTPPVWLWRKAEVSRRLGEGN